MMEFWMLQLHQTNLVDSLVNSDSMVSELKSLVLKARELKNRVKSAFAVAQRLIRNGVLRATEIVLKKKILKKQKRNLNENKEIENLKKELKNLTKSYKNLLSKQPKNNKQF